MAEKKETKKAAAPKPKKEKVVEAEAQNVQPVEEEQKDQQIEETNPVEPQAPEADNEAKEEEIPTDKLMYEAPVAEVKEKDELVDFVETMSGMSQELEDSQKNLDAALENAKTGEEAAEVIKTEINKMAKLNEKAKKANKRLSDMQISNTWNGMIDEIW